MIKWASKREKPSSGNKLQKKKPQPRKPIKRHAGHVEPIEVEKNN
jgi:hypothetical protein